MGVAVRVGSPPKVLLHKWRGRDGDAIVNKHDQERDRIVALGHNLSFQCDGCGVVRGLPKTTAIVKAEVPHDGLRADVAALDAEGGLLGVVEVIRTSAPSERKMEAQARLGFAYRRILAMRPNRDDNGFWFCSDQCRLQGELWKGDTMPPEPPRCSYCKKFYFSNPISTLEFVDWDDPYNRFCIECAIRAYPEGGGQWRSPGEMVGIDLSEAHDDGADDPAAFIYRLGDAAFWRMVWRRRRDTPSDYDGSNHPEREDATRRQLARVDAAFERGDFNAAAKNARTDWRSRMDSPRGRIRQPPNDGFRPRELPPSCRRMGACL